MAAREPGPLLLSMALTASEALQGGTEKLNITKQI